MKPVRLVHNEIGSHGVREVERILRSGRLRRGEAITQLETEFTQLTGTQHAVALSSGTAALQLALHAHGIESGDEVIVPPLCLPPVAAAVTATGAQPVFADIDAYTYTISPDDVSRVITERTKAVLAVHLFGQPCEMNRLAAVAEEHGLTLIEVVWEALGARYHDKRVGTHGTACYSFQDGMSIIAGEGGMLTTNDEHVAKMVRCMANFGCDGNGRIQQPGYNYLMTELTAAVALSQLPRVDSYARLQEYWAMELTHELKEWDGLITPAVRPGARHAFQRYAVRVCPDFPMTPSAMCRKLATLDIEASCNPVVPLHQQPLFQLDRTADAARLANSDRVASELLLLPVHPFLDQDQVQCITRAIGMMATHIPEGEYELDPE